MSEPSFRKRLEEVGHELDQATGRWVSRRRRRRQVMAATCSAVVAVGVAIAVGSELGSNGVEPAAARVLERAAQADPSGAKLRRGRYLYTETLVSTRTEAGTVRQRTELWAGQDGSGVQVAHPEAVEPPSASPQLTPDPAESAPAAPQRGTSGSRPSVVRYGRGTIGPAERGSFDTSFRDRLLHQFGLTARELERLSAGQATFDERVLAGVERVARRLEPSGGQAKEAVDRQAFFLVANLLGQWGEPMPDRLRTALFRLAATLEGIDVDDRFSDDRGRPGIALSLGDARIVLAPDTYRLRSTSYRLGSSETSIETVRTAVVDRRRERP
jgi:hypothetical protein